MGKRLDKAREASYRRPPCKVCVWVDGLKPADRAEWKEGLRLFAAREVALQALLDAFADLNPPTMEATRTCIKRHGNG